MGWSWGEKPYGKIKDYLDDELTWNNETSVTQVLKSSMVGSVYYAAVQKTDKASEEVIVFAAIILTRRENGELGIKTMDETVGSHEAQCPVGMLNLLTKTKFEFAIAWREECRDYHAKRRSQARVKPGQIIEFDHPIEFTNGSRYSRFEVVRYGKAALRYKPIGQNLLCRIRGVHDVGWKVVEDERH